MILIDNYDSFTYNIVQYLKELGVNPVVFKNDEITVDELKKLDFDSIIISPGPKNPDQSGISMDVIGEFYKTKKILGICLGHQCIAQYFGAKIIKDKEPIHGKVSNIYFSPDPIFEGLEQGFEATRYHSLIVDSKSLTECIKPIAFTGHCEEGRSHDAAIQEKVFGLLHCVRNDIKNEKTKSILMALKHKDYPVYGVQFHPEAILTQGGKKLLGNFIGI